MTDEELGKLVSSVHSAHKRLDEQAKKLDGIHTLALSMARLDGEMKEIKTDVSEIKDGMKKVAARPGQWWDKLIAAAIGAVASGLVAAVLSQILK